MDIGKAIRDIRWRIGMTQKEFAEHSGISYMTVYYLERNKIATRISTLENVCNGLGVKMSDLIKEAEAYD